ncbi:MAG TPA: hypothetical protein VI819_00245 [Patescibacteria group bacterium]|nr:hypothetical protein [Patescibacteria group bacterium]
MAEKVTHNKDTHKVTHIATAEEIGVKGVGKSEAEAIENFDDQVSNMTAIPRVGAEYHDRVRKMAENLKVEVVKSK